MIPLYCLRLKACPIFQQLQLEEALLRADQRNWCILNEGTNPAIVMGISGKIGQLVNPELLKQKPIPIIRRFSGGGTVVVDENTLFSTFIFNKDDVRVPCCPKNILEWTGGLYRTVLPELDFQVRENDYALGNKKFGGNAQYMRHQRWLHHSSLLWDFNSEHMNYLLFPPKTPLYRQNRGHADFLCKLSAYLNHKQEFADRFLEELNRTFKVISVQHEEVLQILERPHRKATAVELDFPVPHSS